MVSSQHTKAIHISGIRSQARATEIYSEIKSRKWRLKIVHHLIKMTRARADLRLFVQHGFYR